MFTYTGPSWAASSYPIEDKNATNLAKLWNIKHIDQSFHGAHAIRNFRHLRKTTGPVVWLYNEPIGVLQQAVNMEYKEFLTRDDWQDIWRECNEYCLNSIARLGRPVLLFGAHSDIVDCKHNNIQVGDKSWQRFLADRLGMVTRKGKINVTHQGDSFSFKTCWGADIVHRYMHLFSDVKPAESLVDDIYNIFFFWKYLEKENLFFEVHPNRQGNELYAEYTKPIVEKFLEDTK